MTLSVLASYAFASDYRPLPEGSALMLDSGGFSAWSMGIEVTPEGLAEWYRGIPAQRYAALDVLYDPEASRRNALLMRDLGADVTPAVHAGTSPDEVDRLAADGFTTLALGGLVNRRNSKPDADAWAHACLDRADAHGMKVHGFGLSPTSPARLPLLMRFDSVDSSGWLNARHGKDIRLWDGRMFRTLNMNRDRMTMAAIMRRWPGDWLPALTRHRGTGNLPGSSTLFHLAGAASMLAFGDWLMARGGPRVYLASYLSNMKPAHDAQVLELLDAIGPARKETA